MLAAPSGRPIGHPRCTAPEPIANASKVLVRATELSWRRDPAKPKYAARLTTTSEADQPASRRPTTNLTNFALPDQMCVADSSPSLCPRTQPLSFERSGPSPADRISRIPKNGQSLPSTRQSAPSKRQFSPGKAIIAIDFAPGLPAQLDTSQRAMKTKLVAPSALPFLKLARVNGAALALAYLCAVTPEASRT